MAIFVFLLFPLCAAALDQHVMTVHPGDDATLTCKVGDVSIRDVECTRADPKSTEYVLLYSGGRLERNQQCRVGSTRTKRNTMDADCIIDLKDGYVSLNLENVSSRDSGTYECRVGSTRTKRGTMAPNCIIKVEVTDSKNGHSPRGQAASSGVVAVLLLAAAVLLS